MFQPVFALLAALLLLTAEKSHGWLLPRLQNLPCSPLSNCSDAGEPLLLTPYITANLTERARQLALINGTLPDDPLNTVSYSGFITVNASDNSNTFFWFFDTTNVTLQQLPAAQVPMFVFLEGGPGTSSMLAIFVSNGPFVVNATTLKLEPSVRSLTNLGRVLYIDNPVGVGFSFTDSDDGFARNELQVSTNLYNFMLQFYQLFPDFSTSPLYIIGESYGGKYAPALAYRIHEQQQQEQKNKMPLTGIILADGWSDPLNMVEAYGPMLYNMGMADRVQLQKVNNITDNIRAQIEQGNFSGAFSVAEDLFNYLAQTIGNIGYYYNVVNGLSSLNLALVDYLERCDVRSALHVGNQPYQVQNVKVAEFMAADFEDSVRDWLPTLFNNYRTLLYNGQLDVIVGAPLTRLMLQRMNDVGWGAYDAWRQAPKRIWKYHAHDDGNGQQLLGGYVQATSDNKFVQVVVRGAGHAAQHDQPIPLYDLYQRFVHNGTY